MREREREGEGGREGGRETEREREREREGGREGGREERQRERKRERESGKDEQREVAYVHKAKDIYWSEPGGLEEDPLLSAKRAFSETAGSLGSGSSRNALSVSCVGVSSYEFIRVLGVSG